MKFIKKLFNYPTNHPLKAFIILALIFTIIEIQTLGEDAGLWGFLYALFIINLYVPSIRKKRKQEEEAKARAEWELERKAELDYLAHQIAVENARMRDRTE